MKHVLSYIFLIIILFMMPSCLTSRMAEDELPEQSSLISDEFHVTLDMARSFASSIKERGPIKSEECYSFRGDTLLYLFNYEDGWIVLSSDTRIDLVVASDDKGRMEFNQLLNSKMGVWLDGITEQVLALRRTEQISSSRSSVDFWTAHKRPLLRDSLPEFPCWMRKTSIQTTDTIIESIGPLIQTKWGQHEPWNDEMFYGYDSNGTYKRCILGCASVAMCQILYFTHFNLGKPNGLYHDVSVYGCKYSLTSGTQYRDHDNFIANSTRWNDMAQTENDSHTDYAGDFLMDVGFDIGTQYWVEESKAEISTSSFNNYGISCDKRSYSLDTVHRYLSLGMPLIISAARTKNTFSIIHPYSNYHMWIIDGWRRHRFVTYITYQWILLNSEDDLLNYSLEGTEDFYDYDIGLQENGGNSYTYDSYSTYSSSFLMNWGANGQYDSSEYSTLPSTWQANGKYYQYDAHIFYNFR